MTEQDDYRQRERELAKKRWTILFENESIRIGDEYQRVLEELARLLRHYVDLRLRVDTYAAATEPPERQQALSEDRASAIRNYLVAELGVPPALIETIALGAEGATGNAYEDRRAVLTFTVDFDAPARA
jgi:outer membrane protein OmpA-like peptidoglycan-associated protein